MFIYYAQLKNQHKIEDLIYFTNFDDTLNKSEFENKSIINLAPLVFSL